MGTIIQLSSLIAVSMALALPAQANPGGIPNGGAGAGMGGGVGIGGGGMGMGAWGNGRGSVNLPERGIAGQTGLDTAVSVRSLERSRTSTLDTNAHLRTALTRSLANSGVTVPSGGLSAACSGFSNLGNCVAAMHVAQNLSLPGGFAALKTEMTGASDGNLGKAIKALRPDADTKAALRRAKGQARAEIEASARASAEAD